MTFSWKANRSRKQKTTPAGYAMRSKIDKSLERRSHWRGLYTNGRIDGGYVHELRSRDETEIASCRDT
jgi:hypothetical protein